MAGVQVKVNVINEMKKLKTTAYADRLAWVEELIQNAQRSGATEISVSLDGNKVWMSDNGTGCTDPQVLFEKSSSGWGNEVASQSPFGEGFFSTLVVANKIEVTSVGFQAEFDIRKMFEEESLDCIKVTPYGRKKRGFEVRLTDLENDYDQFHTEMRFHKVMQYLPIRCYLNQKLVPRKKFNDVEGRENTRVVRHKLMKGWLAPFAYALRYDTLGDEVEVFAQGRLVKSLYLPGVMGRIVLEDGVVDLRSPDRKDFVKNEKFQDFQVAFDGELKKTFIKVLKEANDDTLDNLAPSISRNLKVEEYAGLLSFIAVGDKEDTFHLAEVENKKIQDMSENLDGLEVGSAISMDIPSRLGVVSAVTEEDFSKPHKAGSKLPKDKCFYVSARDRTQHADKIALAEYHGVKVILARNVLEENVLKHRGFVPITEFEERVSLAAQLRNIGVKDAKEQRALRLFKSLCKTLDLPEDTFHIGDLSVQLEKQILDKEAIVEERVTALAVAYHGKIFIDRGHLHKSALSSITDSKVNDEDRKFLCQNITVIAHELAHVMFHTVDNTQAHAEAQIEITAKIMNRIF